MMLKCRYSVVHPVMLGVMIAAAIFPHGASSLDPPSKLSYMLGKLHKVM